MSQNTLMLAATLAIFFGLALLPYGCQGDRIAGHPGEPSSPPAGTQKSGPTGPPAGEQGKDRPRLIVLPFQPWEGRPYDGTGLGVHFLLGNVMALHTEFKEFWFGWRVKRIFVKEERLHAYCRGEGPPLDIATLGKDQGIRYWLQGRVRKQGGMVQVALVLTDADAAGEEWATELTLNPADRLSGFCRGFLSWLEDCGFPLPDTQAARALWPEKTTVRGVDLLGQALLAYYVQSSWGEKNLYDLQGVDRAVAETPASYLAHDLKGWVLYKNKRYRAAEKSFRSAFNENSTGLGALSGLMWCAIRTGHKEKAYLWAEAKADLRGESRKAARASVARRLSKEPLKK